MSGGGMTLTGSGQAKLRIPRFRVSRNFKQLRADVVTIGEFIRPRSEPTEKMFRLRFAASSPISEVVLDERGLMSNILIRGENYGGRNQALTMLCGEAANAGFGVIYITEGLVPALTAILRGRARSAFGPARFHALNIAVEKGGKLKVSRRAVSILQFNSHTAPSSVDEIRRRLPGILDWITATDFELPLLLVLENYHLYCREFAAELIERANMANCAVILTTLGSDPRIGLTPQIELELYGKCATILDLNRRRANDVVNGDGA